MRIDVSSNGQYGSTSCGEIVFAQKTASRTIVRDDVLAWHTMTRRSNAIIAAQYTARIACGHVGVRNATKLQECDKEDRVISTNNGPSHLGSHKTFQDLQTTNLFFNQQCLYGIAAAGLRCDGVHSYSSLCKSWNLSTQLGELSAAHGSPGSTEEHQNRVLGGLSRPIVNQTAYLPEGVSIRKRRGAKRRFHMVR
jgi:hypothetical protein